MGGWFHNDIHLPKTSGSEVPHHGSRVRNGSETGNNEAVIQPPCSKPSNRCIGRRRVYWAMD
jgi:hypothetical protein